jgi:prepilin-type N-terminal cleavage/methylation domain-containing protein
MIMNKLRAMKAKKGFTLVELIVVIAIIAILAAILIPLLGNYISDSQRSANAASAKSYAGMIEVKMQEAMNQGGGIDPQFIYSLAATPSDGNVINSFEEPFLDPGNGGNAVWLGAIFGASDGSISVRIDEVLDPVTGKDRYSIDVLYLQDGDGDGEDLWTVAAPGWSDGGRVTGHYGNLR